MVHTALIITLPTKCSHGHDLLNVEMCTGSKCVGWSLSGVKPLIRMYKLSRAARNHAVFPVEEGLRILARLRSFSQLFVKLRHDLSLCISIESLFRPKHLTIAK